MFYGLRTVQNTKLKQKNFFQKFAHNLPILQVYSLYIIFKKWKILPEKYFSSKKFFYVLWTQDSPKYKNKAKKFFSKIWPNFVNFASLQPLLYRQNMENFCPKKIFLQKNFYMFYGLRTVQNAKKNEKKNFQNFGQILPILQVYNLYFFAANFASL